MCSFVNFQIFWSCKESVTAGKWTHERFLSRVYPRMIHELVLSFERLALPWAILPMTGVIWVLWSSNVVHRQVVHYVRHGVEHLVAHLLGLRVLPHADGVHLGRTLLHVSVVGGHVVASVKVVAIVVAGGHGGHKGVCCYSCCSMQAATKHAMITAWGQVRGHSMGRIVASIGRLWHWICWRKWVHLKSHIICHYHANYLLVFCLGTLEQQIHWNDFFICSWIHRYSGGERKVYTMEVKNCVYVLSLWGSGQNWPMVSDNNGHPGLCFTGPRSLGHGSGVDNVVGHDQSNFWAHARPGMR